VAAEDGLDVGTPALRRVPEEAGRELDDDLAVDEREELRLLEGGGEERARLLDLGDRAAPQLGAVGGGRG
jgi:hypothetical protein